MTFLVDNQLPPALVRLFEGAGVNAAHVRDVGLQTATDREIWQYAAAKECVVVSKDEDFLHLSTHDSAGPAFIWVRLGNCRTDALLAAFNAVLPRVVQSLSEGERVIEIQ